MREVVIIDGVRTAVGRKGGALANVRSDDLAALTLEALIDRTKLDKSEVEDVILGCVTQMNEQGGNIARTAALIAGFPITVPGVTIDRQCGSSQQAIHFGSQAIAAGDMDVVIAGGVESMSRSPMFANMGTSKPSPRLMSKYEIVNQGVSAEKIADRWGFTREELDLYSLKSHEKSLKALREGRFNAEIVPISIDNEEGVNLIFSEDEGPRMNTSFDALAQLKPVFQENGKITAGNSSQMSDGASAVLLMSGEKAKELGLKPKARIVARSVIGSDPTLMLTGPIEATKLVLRKAGLTITDMDCYEVNEAFAPVPMAWLTEIGADPDKLNVNGGAIALGHPLGATGTKLMTTLLYELERINGRYGLLAICEGMGMANATIIERIN
ncbi:thiolase family protein [Ornithinibacillus bavariensis]|uniref:thiolase family protein n=1 Tax=Ornithinibacillus bavariensis TaxID=545502 RepID=UPI000EEA59E8|nr:steroid 3-ketoacyl-CoA thiolase [Ornithinibacillus sp.]